ncbi:hypothetical protein [Streptomyces sp. NPDC007088]|uniref:hypothetical protein n=1 Tax=Streptomyces sp. NPDC007088 TaxID=3364773 RepID=UPI0036C5167B
MTGPVSGQPDPPEREPRGAPEAAQARPSRRARPERKQVLLRLDPLVHDALARWAAGELRSTNAQIEFLLRRALAEAGRLPGSAAPIARRGRPRREPSAAAGGEPERPAAADGEDGEDGAP